MSRLICTPTGVIERPSPWTEADLARNWYLIPANWKDVQGNDYRYCHLNQDGAPLCGAVLSEPYEESKYKCAYLVCPACDAWTPAQMVQAGLLDDLEYDEDGRRYDGVRVA